MDETFHLRGQPFQVMCCAQRELMVAHIDDGFFSAGSAAHGSASHAQEIRIVGAADRLVTRNSVILHKEAELRINMLAVP
jgi:hypothetical protein